MIRLQCNLLCCRAWRQAMLIGAAGGAAEQYALCVGVNDCPGFLFPDGSHPRPLRGRGRRRTDWPRAQERFGFPAEHVQTLKGKEAARCRRGDRRLARTLRPDDCFVFHFSGRHASFTASRSTSSTGSTKRAPADAFRPNGEHLLLDDELACGCDDLPARRIHRDPRLLPFGLGHRRPGRRSGVARCLPCRSTLPLERRSRSPNVPKAAWRELPRHFQIARAGRWSGCLLPAPDSKPTNAACRAWSGPPERDNSLLPGRGPAGGRADADGDGVVGHREAFDYVSRRLDATFNAGRSPPASGSADARRKRRRRLFGAEPAAGKRRAESREWNAVKPGDRSIGVRRLGRAHSASRTTRKPTSKSRYGGLVGEAVGGTTENRAVVPVAAPNDAEVPAEGPVDRPPAKHCSGLRHTSRSTLPRIPMHVVDPKTVRLEPTDRGRKWITIPPLCPPVGREASRYVASATLPTVSNPSSSSPLENRVVVPARQAYSHSASVGRRNAFPLSGSTTRKTPPHRSNSHRPPGAAVFDPGAPNSRERIVPPLTVPICRPSAPIRGPQTALHLPARFVIRGRVKFEELAERHFVHAQVKWPGDPHAMLLLRPCCRASPPSSEPIKNSPAGISDNFMPIELVITGPP